MIIRLATPVDAPAIASLLDRAFEEFKPRYTAAAYAASVLTAEGVRARLLEGPLWVAERAAAVMGTVGAAADAKDRGTVLVRGMAVHPAARGLGVARQLLAHVEQFARDGGYTRVSLTTTPFLSEAIAMYRSASFAFTGEETSPHGTTLLTMTKPL